jgi:hypothetical protein
MSIRFESGTEYSGLLPTFEEGALIWDVDYSDSPPPVPPPKLTVIRIPFALTSFLPSQIGSEDDLIDLDFVRQAIIDGCTRSTAPNAPRQRGVSVSWLLGLDTRTVTFVAVVTGIGNEVIVHEIPEEGAVFATVSRETDCRKMQPENAKRMRAPDRIRGSHSCTAGGVSVLQDNHST